MPSPGSHPASASRRTSGLLRLPGTRRTSTTSPTPAAARRRPRRARAYAPGSQVPAPAEPLVPPVADAQSGQPPRERLTPDVRVAAAARKAADVDDQPDPGRGQAGAEQVPALGPVAHGQQPGEDHRAPPPR